LGLGGLEKAKNGCGVGRFCFTRHSEGLESNLWPDIGQPGQRQVARLQVAVDNPVVQKVSYGFTRVHGH
jgi:hypothetical protein